MENWITIINALPESLATGIITAIITGLLLFYFQRRIESSFAEKMEQFKTDLQKELIDHQIIFSTTYPKAIEVLDAGYQELSTLSLTIDEIHSQLLIPNQTLDSKKYREMLDAILKARRKYTRYFHDIRRYLPDEIIPELEKINQKVGRLGLASMHMLTYEGESLDSLIKQSDNISMIIGKPIKIPKEPFRSDDTNSKWILFQKLSRIIDDEFELLKADFNKLYKTVSGG